MIKIFHNPRCSKSRQALGLLQEKGINVQVVEYLKENPTKEELQAILNKLGKSPLELIRKGEAIFKENFKGKEFSDAEWLDIIVENPKLIERPIIFDNSKAVIARPMENLNVFL